MWMRWWLVRWRIYVDAMVACGLQAQYTGVNILALARAEWRQPRGAVRGCEAVVRGRDGAASRTVERHGGGGCRGWSGL